MPARPPGGAAVYHALVLAASRGREDPVARLQGLDHKCLARVAGQPMLQRVVGALQASASVDRIAICVDDPAVLDAVPAIAAAVRSGAVVAVASDATPASSVIRAVAELDDPFPLLITTADSALLTPELVDLFCREASSTGAQVAAGLAPASVILRDYPNAKRTFLRLGKERYSGCNLFALSAPAGLAVVRFWIRVEPYRKRPLKLIGAFGLVPLARYLLGRLTLAEAMARASAKFGVTVAAVVIPHAEAAMDVDKPEDLVLVEEILRRRHGGPLDATQTMAAHGAGVRNAG